MTGITTGFSWAWMTIYSLDIWIWKNFLIKEQWLYYLIYILQSDTLTQVLYLKWIAKPVTSHCLLRRTRVLKDHMMDVYRRFFCPDNEECSNLMNLIQCLQIVISLVKDVVRARFIRNFFHCHRILSYHFGGNVAPVCLVYRHKQPLRSNPPRSVFNWMPVF